MELDVRNEIVRCEALQGELLTIHQRALLEQPPSIRLLLLLASILKLREQARAAVMLTSHLFVEETLCVARTMAEVTVNAAYLQDSEFAEVERFQNFDTQSLYKHSRKLALKVRELTSAESLSKMEEAVAEARLLTGKKDSDSTWSVKKLIERAEFSDEFTKLNLMVNLVLTVYAWSHRAVHGTYDAIQPFIGALATARAPMDDARMEQLSIAISMINFALLTCAHYSNRLLRLGMEAEITRANKFTASTEEGSS